MITNVGMSRCGDPVDHQKDGSDAAI